MGFPAVGSSDVPGLGARLIDAAMTSVLAPLLTLLVVGAGFLLILRARALHAPIGLGSVYAAVVILYGSYPSLMYLALGGYYTPLNDSRLFADQPPPSDLGLIIWYYAIYLASFCVGYLLRYQRGETTVVVIADLDAPSVWALLTTFVAFRATTLMAEVFLAAPHTDYLESYLKYKHLPLLAQQVIGHIDGITAILSLAVVALLCRRWDKYRSLVLMWLAAEFAILIVGLGARTHFVILCLATLFSYHFLYRLISTSALVSSGVTLVVAFLGLGIMRQFAGAGLAAVGVEVVASSSEFETLFANAYDIERLVALGQIDKVTMAGTLYFGDLVNLVPQQLVPFEKLNLATWYVETFYSEYARAGGGFAFGAISESLLGMGLFDLVWRGVLVGLVFCWIDSNIRVERIGFWKFIFFLWLLVSCYQTFRSTMLSLVPPFVYRFLPAMLVVSVLAYLLRTAVLVLPSARRGSQAGAV